jgi:hypothetical protein
MFHATHELFSKCEEEFGIANGASLGIVHLGLCDPKHQRAKFSSSSLDQVRELLSTRRECKEPSKDRGPLHLN